MGYDARSEIAFKKPSPVNCTFTCHSLGSPWKYVGWKTSWRWPARAIFPAPLNCSM